MREYFSWRGMQYKVLSRIEICSAALYNEEMTDWLKSTIFNAFELCMSVQIIVEQMMGPDGTVHSRGCRLRRRGRSTLNGIHCFSEFVPCVWSVTRLKQTIFI